MPSVRMETATIRAMRGNRARRPIAAALFLVISCIGLGSLSVVHPSYHFNDVSHFDASTRLMRLPQMLQGNSPDGLLAVDPERPLGASFCFHSSSRLTSFSLVKTPDVDCPSEMAPTQSTTERETHLTPINNSNLIISQVRKADPVPADLNSFAS